MAKSLLNKNRQTTGYKIFSKFNIVFLWLIASICVLPMVHLLALSLSTRHFSDAGLITFYPKGLTFDAYLYVFSNQQFFRALGNSIFRVVFGVSFNLIITVLIAFPMSKSFQEFSGRRFFLGLIVFTMFLIG